MIPQVLYVYHTVMLFAAAICLAATDVMLCSFLIQTAAHYDLLTRYMGDLNSWLRLGVSHPPTLRAVATRGLAHVIRHHQAIIRYQSSKYHLYVRKEVIIPVTSNLISFNCYLSASEL